MPKISIIDDILAPREYLRLHYEGKNPFKAMTLAPDLLKGIMKIPSPALYETDVRWDISADPREFYGVWYGVRTEDRWSKSYIRMIVQGVQSMKDSTGWVEIIIKGTVETDYEYSHAIQRWFWWFFNYAFYLNQRRKYIDYAKESLYKIKDEMLYQLNILRDEYA